MALISEPANGQTLCCNPRNPHRRGGVDVEIQLLGEMNEFFSVTEIIFHSAISERKSKCTHIEWDFPKLRGRPGIVGDRNIVHGKNDNPEVVVACSHLFCY